MFQFGLVRSDYTPKPAFARFGALIAERGLCSTRLLKHNGPRCGERGPLLRKGVACYGDSPSVTATCGSAPLRVMVIVTLSPTLRPGWR